MVAVKEGVELLEKNKPKQDRAKRTYEAILNAAAELLVEVGVERISTNLVAQRAGVTVPALYRYFPNKYAVLNALGAKVLDKQHVVFQQWFEQKRGQCNPQLLLDDIYWLLKRTYDVTQEQIGGLEVLHALRAVAPLRDLRLTSHSLLSSQFSTIAAESLGRIADDSLLTQTRLTVDSGYAIVERAMEAQPVPAEDILREGTRMIHLYWQDILCSD